MLHIFGLDITTFKDKEELDKYLLCLDAYRREKVLACRNMMDRYRSLACGLLLQEAAIRAGRLMQDKGGWNISVEWINVQSHAPIELEYGFGKNGKPYWKNIPGYCFNLSHSGYYAVCAVSDSDVGVDIQQIRPVRANIAGRFYTGREQAVLEAQTEKEREKSFFRIWSVKESYVKLKGRGLIQGLDTFETDLEEKHIFDKASGERLAEFEEFYVDEGYCGAVCWKTAGI